MTECNPSGASDYRRGYSKTVMGFACQPDQNVLPLNIGTTKNALTMQRHTQCAQINMLLGQSAFKRQFVHITLPHCNNSPKLFHNIDINILYGIVCKMCI